MQPAGSGDIAGGSVGEGDAELVTVKESVT